MIPSERPQLLIAAAAEEREALKTILSPDWELIETDNEEEALPVLEQYGENLSGILLGGIPYTADGRKIYRWLKQHSKHEIPLFIILTPFQEHVINRAMELGAAEVLIKPFEPSIVRQRILQCIRLFEKRSAVNDRVRCQAQDTIRQAHPLQQNVEAIIDTMSALVEFRDFQPGSHVRKVRQITWMLLNELKQQYGLTPRQIEQISTASSMHDIGKIAIPDEILRYPGSLNEQQMETVRLHTIRGYEIIQRMNPRGENQILLYAAEICRSHHERWDGSGYPDGLCGDEIPLSAQVVGLADVYDTIVSVRTYKDAHTHQEACKIIEGHYSEQFSPELLGAFRSVRHLMESPPHRIPVPRYDLPLADELEIERQLRRVALTRNEYRQLSDLSGDIYFYYDYQEQTLELSTAFCHTFGGNETVQKIPLAEIRKHIDTNILYHLSSSLSRLSPDNLQIKTELELETADGRKKWFECYFRAQYNGTELTAYYGKFIDIDKLKTEANRWREEAQTDPLTGLFNRGAMQTKVEMLLRSGQPLTFFFIDLDDFKQINDTYGHPFGDQVLRHIGSQIKKRTRTGDLIGRIGGDEFLAVLPGVKDPKLLTRRAGQLADIFTASLPVEGTLTPQEYQVSGSIGISIAPKDGTEYADLLRKADIALYTAKRAGKNTWRFFEPEMLKTTAGSVLSEID